MECPHSIFLTKDKPNGNNMWICRKRLQDINVHGICCIWFMEASAGLAICRQGQLPSHEVNDPGVAAALLVQLSLGPQQKLEQHREPRLFVLTLALEDCAVELAGCLVPLRYVEEVAHGARLGVAEGQQRDGPLWRQVGRERDAGAGGRAGGRLTPERSVKDRRREGVWRTSRCMHEVGY